MSFYRDDIAKVDDGLLETKLSLVSVSTNWLLKYVIF